MELIAAYYKKDTIVKQQKQAMSMLKKGKNDSHKKRKQSNKEEKSDYVYMEHNSTMDTIDIWDMVNSQIRQRTMRDLEQRIERRFSVIGEVQMSDQPYLTEEAFNEEMERALSRRRGRRSSSIGME